MTPASLWLVIRADLRARRWMLSAMVVVALATAVAVAAFAGAQRTGTALARYARQAHVSNVVVIPSSPNRASAPTFTISEIRSAPQVRTAYSLPYMYFRALTRSHRVIFFADLHLHVSADPRVGRSVDALKMVNGHMANPKAPDELMVSQADADQFGLRVGSRLVVRFGSPSQEPGLDRAINNPLRNPATVPYTGPRVVLRVAGIYADLGTLAVDFGGPVPYRVALLTPAFQRVYGARIVELPLIFASLKRGLVDLPAFQRDLQRRDHGAVPALQPLGAVGVELQRRVAVYVVVLRLLGVLVAALGAVLFAQLLARRPASEEAEFSALRALGMTRGQLVIIGLGQAGILGAVGVLFGTLGAVALSPLTPLGEIARTAEPSPGVAVNIVILGVGAVVALVCTVLAAVPTTWVRSRPDALPAARGRFRAPTLDLPPWGRGTAVVTGWLAARIALRPEGRGRGVALARITAGAMAVALITLVLVSLASFAHLRETPPLYGQDWEVTVGGGGAGPIASTIDQLDDDRAVASILPGSRSEATIDGQVVGLLGLGGGGRDPQAIKPTVLAGHAPDGPNEILLGRQTAAALHRSIDSEVTISAGAGTRRMRVVGLGVIPNLNDVLRLGEGALVSMAGLQRLVPDAFTGYAFVRLRDSTPAARARFVASLSSAAVPGLPPDLSDIGQARGSMAPVVVLLAALGVAALLQAITGLTLKARRDLAVLKALGMEPRQLLEIVLWQAVAGGALILLVGLPLGAFGGRWFWRLFADQLGVSAAPVVPALGLAALAAFTVLAAVGLALIPGRAAARIPATTVLRSE